MLRLVRGGGEFLRTATARLMTITGTGVFSPALYPSSTRIWRAAGYEPHVDLQVWEKSLRREQTREPGFDMVHDKEEWDEITDIDQDAFTGFWRMSQVGLKEALEVNSRSTTIVIYEDDEPVGYSIVGTQWRVGYLHRIGVRPVAQGRGYGRALIAESANWARRQGAQTLVLNVRDDNTRARSVYRDAGFVATNTRLSVLGKGDVDVLN